MFFAGGGVRNYAENSATQALNNADYFIEQGEYSKAWEWLAIAEERIDVLNDYRELASGLEALGFLMVIASFFLLIVGVFKEEKKPIPIVARSFYCAECGNELEKDFKFCTECGNKRKTL